jgi:hypothetical protein
MQRRRLPQTNATTRWLDRRTRTVERKIAGHPENDELSAVE